MENFNHYSVMLKEAVDGLAIKPDGIYVDCTAGGGGHSLEIVKRLTEGGHLYAIDQDMDAIAAAKNRLADYLERVTFIHDNFVNVKQALAQLGVEGIDGALIDLGVSSYQLDTAERGFSYIADAPLDMRMNRDAHVSAYDIINTYEEKELKDIIYKYGEERFAPRIASMIVERRQIAPIETTGELADIVKKAIPNATKEPGKNCCRRTFQAIRVAVNNEIEIIEPTLRNLVSMLNPGGRVSAISFQSQEDRALKQTFASLASGCTCPPNFPVCVCGKKPIVKIVNKKPILPSEQELLENSRSKSSKLRIAEKI